MGLILFDRLAALGAEALAAPSMAEPIWAAALVSDGDRRGRATNRSLLDEGWTGKPMEAGAICQEPVRRRD